jgi:DNA-binding CsgD family transcriptional regulator
MITSTSTLADEPGTLKGDLATIESKINSYVLKNYTRFSRLTAREKEILHLIADGYNSYEISETLFISIHTVNNHRKNIISKLETGSLPHLIRFAVSFGLVE